MSATTPTAYFLVLGQTRARPRSLSAVGVAPVNETLSPATRRPLMQATCSARTLAPVGPSPGVEQHLTSASSSCSLEAGGATGKEGAVVGEGTHAKGKEGRAKSLGDRITAKEPMRYHFWPPARR